MVLDIKHFLVAAACSIILPNGNAAASVGPIPNLWLPNGRLTYSPFPHLFTAIRPNYPAGQYFQYFPPNVDTRQDKQNAESLDTTKSIAVEPNTRGWIFGNNYPTVVESKITNSLLPVGIVNKTLPVSFSNQQMNVNVQNKQLPVRVVNTPLDVTSKSILAGWSSSLNALRRNLTKNNKPGIFINNDKLDVSIRQLPLPVDIGDQVVSISMTNDQMPVSVLNTPLEVSYPSLLEGIESILNKFATKLSNNDCPMYFVNETSSICRKMRPGLFEEQLRCICFLEAFETNYSAAESTCIMLGMDGIAFKNDVGPNRLGTLRPMQALTHSLGIETRNFYIANGADCEVFDAFDDPSTPASCEEEHYFICEKYLP